MVNRIVIGGEIDSSRWAANRRGFFVTLKQTRGHGPRPLTDYFVVYGNPPLAAQLESHVKAHSTLTVEGALRTYRNERTKEWKTAIEVHRIVASPEADAAEGAPAEAAPAGAE